MGDTIKKNPHWIALITLAISIVITVSGFSKSYGSLDERVDNIEEKTSLVPTNREFELFEKGIDVRFENIEKLLDALVKKN